MKAAKFDQLDTTDDGRPIVTLMTDPNMGPGGSEGFLSLVDKGANGRHMVVVKADGSADDKVQKGPGLQGPETEIQLHLGVDSSSVLGWFRRLFNFTPADTTRTSSGGINVQKIEAVEFDEAVAVPRVFKALSEGFQALDHSVWTILNDEAVADKQLAVEFQLSSFAAFVSAAFDGVPVLKIDQARKMAELVTELRAARKQDPDQNVINGADAATISAAQDQLQALAGTLTTLASKAAPSDGDDMDPKKIAQVAEFAAQAAVKACKADNPNATQAELTAAGEGARMVVMKASVMGPAQPGIPNTVLAGQLAESQGMNGKPKGPEGTFQKAINGLTSLTRKMAVHMGLDPETGDEVTLAEDGSNAGLVQVIKVHGQILGKVTKSADAPPPSRQPDELDADGKIVARKTDDPDDAFKGTAFDIT